MTRTRITAAVISLVLLGACSSGGSDNEEAPPESTETSCEQQGPDDETVGEMLERCEGRSATPDEWNLSAASPQGEAYLHELSTVDPELGDDRTLAWGTYLCRDFLDEEVNPADESAVLDRVRMRYAGGDRPELDDSQASTILDAVYAHVCPEFKP